MKRLLDWLILFLFLALAITGLRQITESNTEGARMMIGKRIVIGRDTSTIVDFSSIKKTFTTSTGKEIDWEMATTSRIIQ